MKSIVFVGNPNAGKTTLFNAVTHSAEHTGNWHGVTVDQKRATMRVQGDVFEVVDTPGVYSLTPYSAEEGATLTTLLETNAHLVVQVIEGTHWQKSLYVTLELLETGLPLKLVFTFGKCVPAEVVKYIQNVWGIDCFLLPSLRAKHIKALKRFITLPIQHKRKPLPYMHTTNKHIQANNIAKPTCVCYDFLYQKWQCGVREVAPFLQNMPSAMCDNTSYKEMQILTKYRYLDSALRDIVPVCEKRRKQKINLERMVLHKYLALPIFLCMMLGVFALTFGRFGVWLSHLMGNFISQTLGSICMQGVHYIVKTPWLLAFIEQGVIASCANVLSFLPQIVLLSLCMHVLEEVGYLSRVALLFDNTLQKIGLTGRSVFSMLMGYGCTTSAVVLTRGMPEGSAKLRTLSVLPFTHCSAKMPIFFVMISVFFPTHRVLFTFGLYALSVGCMLLFAYLFSRGEVLAQDFILEMPYFRPIRLRSVWQNVYSTIKNFVGKVASVVILVSCILFVLLNFDTSFVFLQGSAGTSILQTVGEKLCVVLAPMGLNHWAIFTALVCGVVAKELVLSSLALANGVVQGGVLTLLATSLQNPEMPVSFTPLTSIVFLLFIAFYMPCIATITAMRKEGGRRVMWKGILTPLLFSYSICTLVYQLGGLYLKGEKTLAVLWAILIALLTIVVVRYYAKIKKQKGKQRAQVACAGCGEMCGKGCCSKSR